MTYSVLSRNGSGTKRPSKDPRIGYEKQARDKWVDKYLKSRPTTYNGEVMSRYDAYMSMYNGNEDIVLEDLITPEDVARIKLVSDILRERMAESGMFEVLPKLPETGEWKDAVDLTCPFCILDIAKGQGADFVMTSAVIRTSTIIVYLRAELDNVATAKAVTVGDVMFKNFDNEDQVRGAADYWMKVHGDELKEAMERGTGIE